MTIGLPVRLSIVSGLNAIAHAAEGLYAKDGNPVMSLMAEEGIRSLANGLRGVKKNSKDKVARSDCLYGAWLCGMVLGNVGMALHHKLCHTLGGTFNLPHAETHAIVLPHALAYNSTVADEAMGRIARALNVDSAPDGLYQLNEELGVPRGLREIGLGEADLDYACKVALSNPYWNPRPIEEEPLRALLQRAWEGPSGRVSSARCFHIGVRQGDRRPCKRTALVREVAPARSHSLRRDVVREILAPRLGGIFGTVVRRGDPSEECRISSGDQIS